MSKAIGLVEYRTISSGINAADLMLKTAEVSVIEAHPVCPGKYIILVTGGLSAVQASVDAAKAKFPEMCVDSFVLGNPHESIFSAIYGAGEVEDVAALGIIETFSVASAIVAADAAAKTSLVDLIELRLARGMAGKCYAMLTGDVAAVTAAIERAKQEVGTEGMYLDSAIIPRPDKKLWETIL
jgi:microcompartment protein CcmL/EutN